MIFEIRSYHFEPSRMQEYRQWALSRALPYLREQLDVVAHASASATEAPS